MEADLRTVPDRLGQTAFIADFVLPLLHLEATAGRARLDINSFITNQYILSYLSEFDASCLVDLPFADSSDVIWNPQGQVSHRRVRQLWLSLGIDAALLNAPESELVQVCISDAWRVFLRDYCWPYSQYTATGTFIGLDEQSERNRRSIDTSPIQSASAAVERIQGLVNPSERCRPIFTVPMPLSISELKSPTLPPVQGQIVLLFHGIRTHGSWEERIHRAISREGITVVPLRYGYFDVFRFWFPFWTRQGPIHRLQREIHIVKNRHPDKQLSIIAHSFGTYAISRILQDEPTLEIYRLVLCGSIIPTKYRWDQMHNRRPDNTINECGSRDMWPVLAQSLSWGYGPSGTFGFGTACVKDRFHNYRHSDYFKDEFINRFWVPFVTNGEVVQSEWEVSPARRDSFWWSTLLQYLPLKYLIPALVVVIVIVSLLLSGRDLLFKI